MGRNAMVTRTFETTTVKLLAVRLSTEGTETVEMMLAKKYKDDAAILKQCEKLNADPDIKLVAVVSKVGDKTLYGMDEADFLKYAKPLPPRKVHETDESAEN